MNNDLIISWIILAIAFYGAFSWFLKKVYEEWKNKK